MKTLKIAVFVVKFDPTRNNPWLTDEMCDALEAQGHSVDVFFLDWYRQFAAGAITKRGNTTVHIVAPVGGKSGLIAKILHWSFSSLSVYRHYRQHFKRGDHDALIVFSPSIMFGFALLGLQSMFKDRLLIQWDFFPYHQEQIGLIPYRWITRVGAALESKLLSTFDYIGCMSPRNVEYLKKRYRLGRSTQVGVIPLWARIRDRPIVNVTEVRLRFGLPHSTPVAVFGGQLAAGRGVEDVYAAAQLAAQSNAAIHFLFIGKGPKLGWLQQMSRGPNTKFSVLDQVPREKYLELIACCDIGIVATVRDVDVPTFPSKTIDYCCVGLPILASVERSTDFGEIIAAAGIGVACEAGDGARLLSLSLKMLADDKGRRDMSRSSRLFYEQSFDVQKIASLITSRFREGASHAG